MKIKSISKQDCDTYYDTYKVVFKPNFIERLFGAKEKEELFKDTGNTYLLGDGAVYVNQKGEKLGVFSNVGQAIDNFRRSF